MANINTEIIEIQQAAHGSEVRQTIVSALNKINANVLPDASASDSGKILRVNSNGEWVKDSLSGYMPIPTASKSIVENGTYDVTNYAEAVVNVPSGGMVTPVSIRGPYTTLPQPLPESWMNLGYVVPVHMIDGTRSDNYAGGTYTVTSSVNIELVE